MAGIFKTPLPPRAGIEYEVEMTQRRAQRAIRREKEVRSCVDEAKTTRSDEKSTLFCQLQPLFLTLTAQPSFLLSTLVAA
jgi:hypothetical protein